MNLLNNYIIALTNLYGIVSVEKLIEIYNSQNEDQITLEEVNALLTNLPEELSKAFVYSHQGFFVHETVMEFDDFDSLMMKKGSKPYYVPKKEELFNYVDDGYYEVTKEYDALQNYIKKHLIKDEDEAQELVEEIHGLCQFGADMKSIMNSFNDFNVNFKDMDQVNEVMQLVMGMANNIRIWENNGFTPNEIFEKFEKPNLRPLPDKPFEVKKEKIGRNDPCPCGSGKKYKKCCLGKVYH